MQRSLWTRVFFQRSALLFASAALLTVAGCKDDPEEPGKKECVSNADCPDTQVCNASNECVDKTPSATCGDGTLDAGEECDDGPDNSNTEPNACRVTCVKAHCGDGVVDAGEQCDDGANDGTTCNADCTVPDQGPFCGDGNVDEGEECDDGADNSDTATDACRENCAAASCGDGVVDTGEECDDGVNDGTACMSDCTLPAGGESCGDGVVDADEGEECDDGELNSDTAPNACRENCRLAHCGDGTIDDDEACDDGASNSDSTPDACRSTCVLPTCGDGVVDSNEECDAGDDNGGPACAADCTLPPPTAFRMQTAEILEPGLWLDFGSCGNQRPLINQILAGQFSEPDDDGKYGVSIAALIQPVDASSGATGAIEIHFPECAPGASAGEKDVCEAVAGVDAIATTYSNPLASGPCMERIPAAADANGYSDVVEDAIDATAFPVQNGEQCIVASTDDTFTLSILGLGIPLAGVSMAANYAGDPVDALNTGMLRGFISTATAESVIFPDDVPLVGGKTFASLLAGGADACQTAEAMDQGPDGAGGVTDGWWFYLGFTATEADWTGLP